MNSLIEIIEKIVRKEIEKLRFSEMGVVSAIYPYSENEDNYECDVKLKNSGLELKRVSVTAPRMGTAEIPNKGDLVLIDFVRGDSNAPIITGRLYNDEDRPPPNKENEIISWLPLHAKDKEKIITEMRSFDGKREVLLKLPEDVTLRVVDNEFKGEIGKTGFSFKQDGEGVITIEAGKSKVNIKQDGDIEINSQAKIDIKAVRDLSIQAQNIKLKSSMDTKIEAGTSASIKGNTGATLESTAATTVKGVNISIKGMTSFSPG